MEPPVETITGFLVLAILSINIQSFKSELAILDDRNSEFAAEPTELHRKAWPSACIRPGGSLGPVCQDLPRSSAYPASS